MAPRKKFTCDFKLKVINYAKEVGSNREAARHFEIDEKNVRNWVKAKNVLQCMPKNKKARRHRNPHWPELEKELLNYVIETRQQKRRVTTVDIKLKARQLAKEKNEENFKGGDGWCHNFMRRAKLAVRAVTSIGKTTILDDLLVTTDIVF